MRLEDINLLDPDRFAAGAPHEELSLLRREAPVWRHPEPDGPGFWVVTKHADVLACSRDPLTFSSAAERGGVVGMEEMTQEQAELAALEGEVMLYMDPPKHTRYRALVSRGFNPSTVARLEGNIHSLTTRIFDDAVRQGTFDFVSEVAHKIPLAVICEILGVPDLDREKISRWTHLMSAPDDEAAEGEALSARMQMYSYIAGLREERRENPGEDFFSELLKAAGGDLSDMELDIFFLLLASAGNETTRNALSAGVHALISNPDQMERLTNERDLIPSAVEELLRWSSPVVYFRRNVTKSTEVRGVTMNVGDKVALSYLSANRDEEMFSDPHRFDIERTPNEHVSFGGGGPHFCLGASLARLEIRLVLETLVVRMPDLRLTEAPERLRSNFLNALKRMPVDCRPAPSSHTP